MISLRDLKNEDSAFVVEQLNKLEVVEFLTARIPFPYTEKDADEWINGPRENKISSVIELEKSMVGVIGVTQGEFEFKYSGEIGYWLGSKFWGKGIATEAIRQMTEHVFTQTKIVRLTAHVFGPNKASMVALQKNGYELEAIHKQSAYKNGQFYDMHLFVKSNL